MKKKGILIACVCFLLMLFTSMMFTNDNSSSQVNHEMSEFDSTVSGGDSILDGNVEYEVKNNYEGNKLSNLNAAISNKVTGIFTRIFEFIKKIIKKIVS